MTKEETLAAFRERCFNARVPVYKVCELARVAPSTLTRWRTNPDSMSVRTLKRLEDALDEIEGKANA